MIVGCDAIDFAIIETIADLKADQLRSVEEAESRAVQSESNDDDGINFRLAESF